MKQISRQNGNQDAGATTILEDIARDERSDKSSSTWRYIYEKTSADEQSASISSLGISDAHGGSVFAVQPGA